MVFIPFLLILLYSSYALSTDIRFTIIGRLYDCKNDKSIVCSVMYLPSNYFIVEQKCLHSLLNTNRGAVIEINNNIVHIKSILSDSFIITDQKKYYYINYNASNSFYDDIQFYSFDENNNRYYIKYSNSIQNTVNKYVVGYSREEFLINTLYNETDYTSLFEYTKRNSIIEFYNIGIYPNGLNEIKIEYNDKGSCQKNNLIYYHSELFDEYCEVHLN